MGTIAEKLTYLNGTKTAIKGALQNRGVTVSDADTFRSYADKVGQIGETVEKTKFGASVDTFIGDVDENGTLNKSTWTGTLNFAGVKIISFNSMVYKFYNCSGITSVDLSSVQSISNSSMTNAFSGCTSLTSVDLSSLQLIGGSGMTSAFNGCTSLISVDLSSLQTVELSGLGSAFSGCTSLISVDLSSLQSIGTSSMTSTFTRCKMLTTMSFPSLTSVQTSSFGSASYNAVFNDCTGLTEIHFRADMQATIEAMSLYTSKFGAPNATICFDL